ncbi:PfkB family carbohydrate kinase [Alphaproteobacteria bacterium LSUCC0684]
MSALLSIQSAVTYGAVGNTMAELVMAGSRHHLCRIDTVQLTAHPGHGFRAGGSLPDTEFADLLGGLSKLGIWADFAAIMIGYIGRAGQVTPIKDALARYRQESNGPVLLDPAIGDHGRIYVDKAVADGVLECLLPEASILTPNAFELGYLTSSSITGPEAAEKAAFGIIATHPNIEGVAVTGIALPSGIADAWIDRSGMTVFEKPALVRNRGGYSGAGDLFAALLMVHWLNGASWKDAATSASQLADDVLRHSDNENLNNISLDAVRQTASRIRDHA